MENIHRSTHSGVTIDKWLHKTCGLAGIQGLNRCSFKDDYQSFLDNYCDPDWSGSKQGNIMFAVTSTQLQNPGEFTKFLCYHKNTRFIHWYKNNAHGPNVIFIGMYHKFPEDVERPLWRNNIEKLLKRLVFNQGEYHMK